MFWTFSFEKNCLKIITKSNVKTLDSTEPTKLKFIIFKLINRKKAPIKNSCIVQIEQIKTETIILEKIFPITGGQSWY